MMREEGLLMETGLQLGRRDAARVLQHIQLNDQQISEQLEKEDFACTYKEG